MTAKTTKFEVFIHENQVAHNPDGTINYKQLNGYVYDNETPRNNIGVIHLTVKADVDFPVGGEALTVTFSDNSKLGNDLKPVAAEQPAT